MSVKSIIYPFSDLHLQKEDVQAKVLLLGSLVGLKRVAIGLFACLKTTIWHRELFAKRASIARATFVVGMIQSIPLIGQVYSIWRYNHIAKFHSVGKQIEELWQEHGDAIAEDDEFVCPITYDLMKKPVRFDSPGFKARYELDKIEQWVRKGAGTDPLTNLEIPKDTPLVMDRELQDKILAWLQQRVKP